MPSDRRAWLAAIVATLAMTVSYADRQVMAAIGTSLRQSLAMPAESFGWLAAAFSAAYLVATPLAGTVLNRIGPRVGLAIAVIAWSSVSAAHALVSSFGALLAMRIALGVAEAPSFPGAALSVRRVMPPEARSTAFGLIFTGSSLGAALVAPLAVALDARFGYRAAFAVTSLLGLAWVPFWLAATRSKAVRETLGGHRSEGCARMPRGADGTAAVVFHGSVTRAVVLTFLCAPGLMFVFLWFPQYLTLGCGVAKQAVGHYAWFPPLMADFGNVGFGYVASRLNRVWPGRSRAELVVVAAMLEATLAWLPRACAPWPAVALVGVAAAGGGGLYTLLTADMMARVEPGRASTAAGLTAAAQSLAYVLGNPAIGRLVDHTHSFVIPLRLVGVVVLPGAAAWVLWPIRRARVAEP